MISKILVASDGSETARKACEYAVALAGRLGAGVVFLFVIDENVFSRPVIPVSMTATHMIDSVEAYFRDVAETVLKDLEDFARKEAVTAEAVVRKGHPVEEIVKAAQESGADLIVVGSHGRSALKAALLGSVAYGVAHKDATIPVLIVRRQEG
jgi:nucleotide-binding universal stress UspA family protein